VINNHTVRMENELCHEESVSFINGKNRQNSSKSTETKHRRQNLKYAVFIGSSCLAVVLLVLAFTVTWHKHHTYSAIENSIARSSFKFCGNQSAKACIQDPACSLSRQRRLVNGKIAREYTWPWMAEIVYNNEHYCGAVLISDDVLLTAAHCLYHRESRLYVDDIEIRIGSRRKLSTDNNTQILKVSSIHIHEFFKLSSLQNDIAVLKLNSPVRLSRSCWPICLGSKADNFIGRGIMTGWGKTSIIGRFSSLLREASVPIVPVSRCIEANRDLFDGVKVSGANHICVGYGKDRPDYGCNGDSGGPLMIQSNNGKWLLIGVMSWGEPQCSSVKTNSYTVFTSISPYLDWIEKLV